jgi:hypothetical protein
LERCPALLRVAAAAVVAVAVSLLLLLLLLLLFLRQQEWELWVGEPGRLRKEQQRQFTSKQARVSN